MYTIEIAFIDGRRRIHVASTRDAAKQHIHLAFYIKGVRSIVCREASKVLSVIGMGDDCENIRAKTEAELKASGYSIDERKRKETRCR